MPVMTNADQAELVLFAVRLARALPRQPPSKITAAVMALKREAATHQRLTNDALSAGHYAVSARLQLCEERIRLKVRELCGNTIPVAFSDDPRGRTVHLKFPDGAFNTLGGPEAGWVVP